MKNRLLRIWYTESWARF